MKRIVAIDTLRGFAILGILVMNIMSFAMPEIAYFHPAAFGGDEWYNQFTYTLVHIFADQKFMTIFSILFGAGIVLVTEKSMKRTGKSAGLHYRRNFWLLVIGLLHAHLIWHGDILVSYALCAFWVYWFRNAKPKTLLIVGILFIAVHTVFYALLGLSLSQWPPESIEAAKESWIPTAEFKADEIAAVTGSLSEQIAHNSGTAVFMEIAVFLMVFLWRAGGLMLVGMALYKWGVLSAKRSKAFYTKGFIIGCILGLLISGYGMYTNFQANFSFEYSMYLGSQWNYWGSLFMSFGYICMIMLIAKSDVLNGLKKRLAAVGQMALTNYLIQSIICVFIFWGIGLGLFGQFERWQQALVALGVWLLQILWSKPWLDKFQFGPFEWLWRSLTYMKKQAFKKG